MKLSDAILLGSTVLAPQAGRQYSSETKAGCALGMAAIANGCTFRTTRLVHRHDRRTLGTEGVWGSWVLTMVRRPCNCWRLVVPREMRIKDVIAHTFDHHVTGKMDWTLEQLVEWVKMVEPDDATPPHATIGVQRGYLSVATLGRATDPALAAAGGAGVAGGAPSFRSQI